MLNIKCGKNWSAFAIFKNLAKLSPNRRKFAQFGHPQFDHSKKYLKTFSPEVAANTLFWLLTKFGQILGRNLKFKVHFFFVNLCEGI
jgi:hypothetical protein